MKTTTIRLFDEPASEAVNARSVQKVEELLTIIEGFLEKLFGTKGNNDNWLQFLPNAATVRNSVKSLCSLNYQEAIFAKVREYTKNFVASESSFMSSIEVNCQASDYPALLQALIKYWKEFFKRNNILQQLFMHLERPYILTETKYKSFRRLGLSVLQEKVQESQTGAIFLKAFISVLNQERSQFASKNAASVSKSDLSSLTQASFCLRQLRVDGGSESENFTDILIASTTSFYANFTSQFDFSNIESLCRFLELAEKVLAQEKDISRRILELPVQSLLVNAAKAELLLKHANSICITGVPCFIQRNERVKLSQLYFLMKEIGKTELLSQVFKDGVKRNMSKHYNAIMKSNDAKIFLELVENRLYVENLANECFNSEKLFERCLSTAVKEIVNEDVNVNIMEEHISVFCTRFCEFIDAVLLNRNLLTGSFTESLFLSQFSTWFGLLADKDMFQIQHRKLLSRRLLHYTHTDYVNEYSLDLEKKIVMILKQECGPGFVAKFIIMLKDINMQQQKVASVPSNFLNPLLLTSGSWPVSSAEDVVDTSKCILPKFMQSQVDQFEVSYKTADKYGKKKITWMHSLSQLEVEAVFDGKTKILIVSLFQSLILHAFDKYEHFEKKTAMSFAELLKAVGIPDDTLEAELLNLLSFDDNGEEKEGVLLREGDDVWRLNKKFQSHSRRVKFAKFSLFEAKKNINPETREKVLRDRQHYLESVLVRIMKKAKTISQQDLLAEAPLKLRFPVSEDTIKERIESLITRDFIERDEQNAKLLVYVP